jgi:hypothetical protein
MTESKDPVNQESTLSAKVLDIKDKQKKRTKKEDNADTGDKEDTVIHLKASTIERDLCGLLEGIVPPLLSNMPAFPYRFENMRSEPRDKSVQLQIENNTATLVNIEYIAAKLRLYVQDLSGPMCGDYAISQTVCEKIVEAWTKLYIHRDKLPKPLGFKSDPEICIHRLNFDPVPTSLFDLRKNAPQFHDYLERMTNSTAFCMRVGSLFDSRAHRKQSIWVEGPKDSGKSQLAAALTMVVGKAFTVISEEDLQEKFWKESIVGKRLVIFNEISPKFIRTAAFKNLTGDALHRVRPFGGGSFQTYLYPILFNFSNDSPLVQGEAATTERLIHCQLAIIPEEKRINEFSVLEKFEREIPYFVNYCYGLWKTHPDGRDIPNDEKGRESLAAAVEEHEAPYLDFIGNYLELGKDLHGKPYRVPIYHVQKLMIHAEMRSGFIQGLCKKVILRQAGVTQTFPRDPTPRIHYYNGVRILPKYTPLLLDLLKEHF